MPTTDFDTIERIDTESESRVEQPKMFKVLIHNDDFTTVEFVITLLRIVFHKDEEEATEITLMVHHTGAGVAGVFTKEVAEEKTEEANALAAQSGFPLKITYEEL